MRREQSLPELGMQLPLPESYDNRNVDPSIASLAAEVAAQLNSLEIPDDRFHESGLPMALVLYPETAESKAETNPYNHSRNHGLPLVYLRDNGSRQVVEQDGRRVLGDHVTEWGIVVAPMDDDLLEGQYPVPQELCEGDGPEFQIQVQENGQLVILGINRGQHSNTPWNPDYRDPYINGVRVEQIVTDTFNPQTGVGRRRYSYKKPSSNPRLYTPVPAEGGDADNRFVEEGNVAFAKLPTSSQDHIMGALALMRERLTALNVDASLQHNIGESLEENTLPCVLVKPPMNGALA